MSKTSSALRAELDKLNSPAQRPALKPEDVAQLGQVLLWRVVVEPIEARRTNPGGLIEVPEDVIRAEEISTRVGRVLQIGHFAFQSKTAAGLDLALEPNKPKVGDHVLFEMYAGQEIKLRAGNRLRILNETEILMVIDDPDQIVNYL